MALSVLAIGAVGVIGLQKATLIANNNARMLTSANQIATAWAERLRTDATVWNLPPSGASDVSEALWINWGVTHPNQWVQLGTIQNAASVADPISADIWGGSDVSTPAFCTQVRFNALNAAGTRVRAEIRVFWDRTSRANASCGSTILDPVQFGSVYVTTLLVPNIMPI